MNETSTMLLLMILLVWFLTSSRFQAVWQVMRA